MTPVDPRDHSQHGHVLRVIFEQSGGVAGLMLGCELDRSQLAPDDAEELTRLVAASGLTAPSAATGPGGGAQGARDLRIYVIIVETDSGETRAVFDDATIPDTVGPLLEFLMDRARPRPPR